MLELVPLLFVVFRHFDWDYLPSVTIGKSSVRKGVRNESTSAPFGAGEQPYFRTILLAWAGFWHFEQNLSLESEFGKYGKNIGFQVNGQNGANSLK